MSGPDSIEHGEKTIRSRKLDFETTAAHPRSASGKEDGKTTGVRGEEKEERTREQELKELKESKDTEKVEDNDRLSEPENSPEEQSKNLSERAAGIEPGNDQDKEREIKTAAKARQIHEACLAGDVARLQTLAETAGGFESDELRRIAWPVLLGIPLNNAGEIVSAQAATAAGPLVDEDDVSWLKLPPHRDEDQVQLDVNRAFVHYPVYDSRTQEDRQKRALSDLIIQLLRRHPMLCYFQGFHDICQVFLLVLPPPLQAPAVTRLALLRIRDFLLPTIDAAVQQLQLLPDILHAADPPLWAHLRMAQHPRPFFALSGTLTMYAHDVRSLGAIARLFDVMLARPPVFSLYLFAAIVRAHRAALFATPADEPEMLHHILSKLPERAGLEKDDGGDGDGDDEGTPLSLYPPLDSLVAAAAQLAEAHPPHTLPAWRTISSASVLKTAAAAAGGTTQTIADGERWFRQHVQDMERTERRRRQQKRVRLVLWQYRGPLRAAAVAVAVALAVAYWQRHDRAGGGGGLAGFVSDGSLLSALRAPVASVAALMGRLGL